ncbi:hypothetical protein Tco_0948466 [Tanacetum coccineum]
MGMSSRFSDVAGVDEEKEELEEILEFLRNPYRYTCLGAGPPRGVLLVSSSYLYIQKYLIGCLPGTGKTLTGKTLLAKTVAGTIG